MDSFDSVPLHGGYVVAWLLGAALAGSSAMANSGAASAQHQLESTIVRALESRTLPRLGCSLLPGKGQPEKPEKHQYCQYRPATRPENIESYFKDHARHQASPSGRLVVSADSCQIFSNGW